MTAEKQFCTLLLMVALSTLPSQSLAQEIKIAVASNFKDAIISLAKRFQMSTDHKVTLIFGSTGKHYAQIKHGAPFDVFFAADVRRPQLLEEEGIAVPDSRFTYAIGKIVLWSPKDGYIDLETSILQKANFRHLAIANPKLAPYGKAAKEILLRLNLWERLSNKIVRGENIAQAYQFIKTNNAQIGFVAYSQIKRPNQEFTGSLWEVPQSLYTPIEQQAVLLNSNKATRDFIAFVQSKEALKLIRDYGYDTP